MINAMCQTSCWPCGTRTVRCTKMAAAMAANSRKNPKDTLQEALDECNDLLLKMKKPRKKSRFKFFRDPLTGRRKSHYPYKPRFQEDCNPCSISSVNGKHFLIT